MQFYNVQEGDTLNGVAYRYQVAPMAIVSLNPDKDLRSGLRKKQAITLPANAKPRNPDAEKPFDYGVRIHQEGVELSDVWSAARMYPYGGNALLAEVMDGYMTASNRSRNKTWGSA